MGPISARPFCETPHVCEEGVQNTADCGIVYLAVRT